MRRWRAFERDANASCVINGNRELRLEPGERHRNPFVADEEWLVRQVLNNSFEILGPFNRPPIHCGGAAGLPYRECARRVAADRRKQSDYVSRRHSEQL